MRNYAFLRRASRANEFGNRPSQAAAAAHIVPVRGPAYMRAELISGGNNVKSMPIPSHRRGRRAGGFGYGILSGGCGWSPQNARRATV